MAEMFTVNHSLQKLDAQPPDVITLLVSTNRPIVAVSGPSQQADAFIISVRKGKSQPVVICFHIIQERERFFYTADKDPTSESARIALEQEAVRFTEDMGFMMVRESFDGSSPEKRSESIMKLAPFVDNLQDPREGKAPKGDAKKAEAQKAEAETEYEEVYEEVIEEVPVEEPPPKPEEYESLSDIIHELSADDRHVPKKEEKKERKEAAAKPVRKTEAKPERKAEERSEGTADRTADRNTREKEQSFDLGREISEEIASLREMPNRAELKQHGHAGEPKPTEQQGKKDTGSARDGRQAAVRLLISL
jgi:hypothetical protein